uniref:Trichoplein keratin filament-binding protein n=1 Tax=Myotis lucifugus TaxID=59463 RepID=G1QAE8_MYOLU
MALPTLPPSWCSRRLLDQQVARQRHREQEARLRQQWDENSRYFRISNACSSKQAEWSSQASYQRSTDCLPGDFFQLEIGKKQYICTERNKMIRNVCEEKKINVDSGSHLVPQRPQRDAISPHIFSIWCWCINIYTHALYLYKNIEAPVQGLVQWGGGGCPSAWPAGSPPLRVLVQVKQIQGRQCPSSNLTHGRFRAESGSLLYWLEHLPPGGHCASWQRLLRQASPVAQSAGNGDESEREATKLKKERENLLKQRWELERLAEERKQMAALRQKAELGRFLRHQYNVQLNRRAQQIQEELEADKRILQALLEEEEEAQREHSARREQARADVAWMQQVLEEQLQREREQEAELQMLLREEAKEMWEKREAEWARERSARDRLMAEVLTGRQQQIQEKIEQNRRAQEESLRHREQLIQNLEEARESARREKEESEELKSARKQELEAQVAERQLQAWEADQQEAEEEEEARQAEQLTNALLQQEAKMMAKQGYRPKPYGHPRIAWN